MHALSILASGDDSGGGGGAFTLLIFLVIPVAMYFLMIRPQRRRMKEQNAMQAAIGVGDEVVTNSGIYGFITGVEGDKFWLEIDDDVQIRIARAAIQGRVNPVASTEDAKDVGDTKSKSKDAGSTAEES